MIIFVPIFQLAIVNQSPLRLNSAVTETNLEARSNANTQMRGGRSENLEIPTIVPKPTKIQPPVEKSSKFVAESRNQSPRYRYPPGVGNPPGGNDNGNDSDPISYSGDSGQWVCPVIPDSDTVISNPEFWRSFSKTTDQDICSLTDESDEDIDDDFDDDLPELPSSFSKNGGDEQFPRRRLLSVNAPTPTGQLDIPLMNKYDTTTYHLPLLKYQAYDGRKLTMGDFSTKKITYSHQTDLNIANNLPDRISCPIQSDPNKFQRIDCWAITDRSRGEVVSKVFELTTTYDSSHMTLEMPMIYKPDKTALVYLDLLTGEYAYFHDDGRLWSADQFSSTDMALILKDPKVIKHPKVEYKDTYEYWMSPDRYK